MGAAAWSRLVGTWGQGVLGGIQDSNLLSEVERA
jgi:hypothetical protein